MCKFRPDYYIEDTPHFNGLCIKGIKLKLKLCITNYDLAINLNYIYVNLYSLDRNDYTIKNQIGESELIDNLYLNKRTTITTDFIIIIYWTHLIFFFPILLKKSIKLLVKGEVSYSSILKSGIDYIEEIKSI